MENYLLINEGFASVLTQDVAGKDEKTVSHWLLPTAFKMMSFKEWKEIHSTRVLSRKRMREWLAERASPKTKLLLVGKSMGVVETFDMMDVHWPDLSWFRKIAWLCVDGHSKLLKDMFKKKYCEKKAFKRDERWDKSQVHIVNVFQNQTKPMGARFDGADVQVEVMKDRSGKTVDHFSIISTSMVQEGLKNAIEWLKK